MTTSQSNQTNHIQPLLADQGHLSQLIQATQTKFSPTTLNTVSYVSQQKQQQKEEEEEEEGTEKDNEKLNEKEKKKDKRKSSSQESIHRVKKSKTVNSDYKSTEQEKNRLSEDEYEEESSESESEIHTNVQDYSKTNKLQINNILSPETETVFSNSPLTLELIASSSELTQTVSTQDKNVIELQPKVKNKNSVIPREAVFSSKSFVPNKQPLPFSISKMEPPSEIANEKKLKRMMKNREAAKLCRKKKKDYIKELEKRIIELEERNKFLENQLEQSKIGKI